jgi:hypothetical protein
MLVWCHWAAPTCHLICHCLAHDGTPTRLPAGSPRYRQLIAQHPDPVTS